MPLYKLADFDPNYAETLGGDDITTLDLYTEGGVRVGSVSDVLVDADGRFRYLVIDTEYNSSNKRILLPIGLSRTDYNQRRVYVDGLSKEQVQSLPVYKDDMSVDYDYEEQLRNAYRPNSSDVNHNQDTYNYKQDAPLYDLNDQNHQTFKLYQERLIANKNRVKTGEVAVSKHIETEIARVSVPIEKERVIIERINPTDAGIAVNPSEFQFQEGEIARIEIYEEKPDIHKETFVREEVRVRKVVKTQTIEAQETIRREELDVRTQGDLPIAQTDMNPNDLV
ncbi:MAG: DUF2382 domain-containing protein [Brasilonema octagenarum HA4186-MV1]|jgi:uncharacterized protein (TIGR02271 family)|uniref:Photosystem reaction center subunit H n=2 Tax=Brasilonema TaxID=383614 RepID=A0A856MMZ5_9CYAN|nr:MULTISPECIES: DUF2382 domain-containing protein [Brasilonema]MBW4629333.1 DUF2382 domain-containing protein [Brasilonema octagenarum HA4186-MV1]NMF64170.1 photosystem reaction center subunit H [Brasilonema octagenarum UFV-OR1]QDL11789.1 photosystem reaction center subunit H [Brasilonema sennae CENA114]QDL18170.1 photosystem reaction center subunit H [Brasilonema octagenarum UFV-E1]